MLWIVYAKDSPEDHSTEVFYGNYSGVVKFLWVVFK